LQHKKSGQQFSLLSEKNFIFFHCPLDGMRFRTRVAACCCFICPMKGISLSKMPDTWAPLNQKTR